MSAGPAQAKDPGPVQRLADAVRDLMDSVVAADLSDRSVDDLVGRVERLTASFGQWQPLDGPIDSRMPGAPAHARIGRVPWVWTDGSGSELTGRARFRLIHAGSTGVVHGGAVAFLMDEVMGVLANAHVQGVAQTVALAVDYKKVTPVGVDLVVRATQQGFDGRKQWVEATLTGPDDNVLATARAFFLTVVPS